VPDVLEMVAALPALVETSLAKLPDEPLVPMPVTVWVVPAVSLRPLVNPALLIFRLAKVLESVIVMLSPEKVTLL